MERNNGGTTFRGTEVRIVAGNCDGSVAGIRLHAYEINRVHGRPFSTGKGFISSTVLAWLARPSLRFRPWPFICLVLRQVCSNIDALVSVPWIGSQRSEKMPVDIRLNRIIVSPEYFNPRKAARFYSPSLIDLSNPLRRIDRKIALSISISPPIYRWKSDWTRRGEMASGQWQMNFARVHRHVFQAIRERIGKFGSRATTRLR